MCNKKETITKEGKFGKCSLKNQHIEKELNEYIKQEKHDGAFYINGAWGSGKTYFIRQFAEKYNDSIGKDRKQFCTYISLEGLRSIDEINSEIYASCHPKLSKIKNHRVTKTLLTIGKGVGNYFGIEKDTSDEFVNNLCALLNNKFTAIILDDFERCRIDLQELFGYINSFITQGNVGVILIGYDLEVERYLQSESVFQNKLIAAVLSRNGVDDFKKNIKDANVVDPLLFHSIKEKFIFKKYDYIFDVNVLFDSIANEYSEDVTSVIKDSREGITDIINNFQCENLRICKNAIDTYVKVIKKIKTSHSIKVKKNILMCCFQYTIINRLAIKGDDVEEERTLLHMQSIRKYVDSMIWDDTVFQKEVKDLESYFISYEKKTIPTIMKKLDNYWAYKTDDVLTKEIKELIDNINSDRLSVDYYKKALYYVAAYYKKYDFKEIESLDSICSKMVSNIESREKITAYDDMSVFLQNGDSEILKEYFRKIDVAVSKKQLQTSKEDFSNYFLLQTQKPEEISKQSQVFRENKQFFAALDINKLFEATITCETMNIIVLRKNISRVYEFANLYEFFPDDIENINEFLKLLKGYDYSSQKIKNVQIKQLILDLEKYKKQLKNPFRQSD